MYTASKRTELHTLQSCGILIAAAGSGSGKTMFTCGLLRLLRQKGYNSCAFKCGPDYIDPSFHKRVLGVPSYNLDPFFTEESVLRQLYETHGMEHDISVIEGVMGYYDGLGFSDEASTYSVAKALEVPVLLLVDCKGMGHSVMAIVEGFVKHRQPSRIQGVLFNRMAPSLYEKAADAVRDLGLRPLGYLPENKELHLESRHLGLVMADEVQDFTEKMDAIAERIAETVDVEGIIKLARNGMAWQAGQSAEGIRRNDDKVIIGYQNATEFGKEKEAEKAGTQGIIESNKRNTGLRIAVAQDEAFCFLYEDNLNFLREKGAEIVFFSPLHDREVPPDCDALYLSGGYPELYAGQLEQNFSMKKDIRDKIAAGMPCIAECGGFLYLHEQLEALEKLADRDSPERAGNAAGQIEPEKMEQVMKQPMRAKKQHFYKMAGVLPAQAVSRRRKGHFGYIKVTLKQDCLLGKKGDSFRAHEFHYWESSMEQEDLHVLKPGNGSTWEEGLCTKTLYAGFPHLYFYGSPKVGENFLAAARSYRDRSAK